MWLNIGFSMDCHSELSEHCGSTEWESSSSEYEPFDYLPDEEIDKIYKQAVRKDPLIICECEWLRFRYGIHKTEAPLAVSDLFECHLLNTSSQSELTRVGMPFTLRRRRRLQQKKLRSSFRRKLPATVPTPK